MPILFLLWGCSDSEKADTLVPQDPSCEDTLNIDRVLEGSEDPMNGIFSLEEALEDLPQGEGGLRAIIVTSMGDISCNLESEMVPTAVANFVGLARGTRPWFSIAEDAWVQRPFYDGLIFHRIIDDFMIQGGDPTGTGYGGPGYEFADEFSGLQHREGTLAYANAGPNTNGSQFYITEVTTDFLDGGYTILGYCQPLEVISNIAAVETDAYDRPLEEVVIQTIKIDLCGE